MNATATATMLLKKRTGWELEVAGVIGALRQARTDTDGLARDQRIAEILESVEHDAEFLYALYIRLRCEAADFPIAMKVAMNFVLPQLTARAAADQVNAAIAQLQAADAQARAAKRFGWAAIWLSVLAAIFGAVQVYFAYVGAYPH